METLDEENKLSFPPNTNNATNTDAEEEENDYEDDVISHYPNRRNPQSPLSQLREQRFKLETLSWRMSSELVPIRVHNVLINGNTKIKDWVIEAELKGIENATTVQELLRASEIALARLQSLGIFESTKVRLEPEPRELPNTTNVVIDDVEAVNKVSGEFGVFTKPAEFDVRYAVPFGFYNTALNLGISAVAVFPWGNGFMDKQSRDGIFDEYDDPSRWDSVREDLAVTAFADLSFDLPIRWLREHGIHGHVLAGAGEYC